MNIRELIAPMILSVLTMWMVQYFFMGKQSSADQENSIRSGQQFVAPETREATKPLQREIDFIDEKRPHVAQETVVETQNAHYVFSTDGASLDRIEFKRGLHGRHDTITTVFPLPDSDKEQRCFLVALNEKTPYYFELIGHQETNDEHVISYKYDRENSDAVIIKTYTVYKNRYQVDLTLDVTPKKEGNTVEARLFFPSPVMPDIASSDIISAITTNEQGSIKKIQQKSLDIQTGWFVPTIFGTSNKYFTHVMRADTDSFSQRAYYKINRQKGLITILESRPIEQQKSWTLSFYMGPKENTALISVDDRLEQILDYSGWLSSISKLLLKILKLLYSYIGNYGFSIIALTLLMHLILLPFTLKGDESMRKADQMKKKMEYLKQKYHNDPQRLKFERDELVRKHGFGGMGLGCLPRLLSLPIFFALNSVLGSSIELYGAPFFGWIQDLSLPDSYYVLPVMISLSMLCNSYYVPASSRPFSIIMALVMGAFMANWAAGVALYVTINTLLIVIQSFLQKRFKSA